MSFVQLPLPGTDEAKKAYVSWGLTPVKVAVRTPTWYKLKTLGHFILPDGWEIIKLKGRGKRAPYPFTHGLVDNDGNMRARLALPLYEDAASAYIIPKPIKV